MPKRPRTTDSSASSSSTSRSHSFLSRRPATSTSTSTSNSNSASVIPSTVIMTHAPSGGSSTMICQPSVTYAEDPHAAAHHRQSRSSHHSHSRSASSNSSSSPNSATRFSKASRFVHGLQTFVGGLAMSQPRFASSSSHPAPQPPTYSPGIHAVASPTASSPATSASGPSSIVSSEYAHQLGHAAAPPPLHHKPVSSIFQQDGVRTAPAGVSPGWHVGGVENGMQAWAATPLKDDDGWSPLQSLMAQQAAEKGAMHDGATTHSGLGGEGQLLGAPHSAPIVEEAPRTSMSMDDADWRLHARSDSHSHLNTLPPLRNVGGSSSSASGAMAQSPDASGHHHSEQTHALAGPTPLLQHAHAMEREASMRSFATDSSNDSIAIEGDMIRRACQNAAQVTKQQQQQPRAHAMTAQPSLPVASRPAPPPPIAAAASHQQAVSPVFQQRPQYSLEDFEMIETLGTGTFGRVMLVRLRHAHPGRSEAYFAMKVLAKTEVVRLKQVEHINSERAILSQVDHPFVVNLFCTFQDSKNVYMLMEYVMGGEIFSHLRRAGRFSADVTRFYIATLVLAIDHLHQHKIIYRDLKPENLLLDSRGYTKITDFGFAKRVEGRTWTLCGTPEYLAPEIIESKGHSAAVDWWALGILMYEMLAGFPPFFDNHPFGTYEKILKAPLVFPSHIDAVSRDLIRQLLTRDVSKRLGNLRGGAEDVKSHFWFHGVDWIALQAAQLQAPIIPRRTKVGSTENFSKYAPPNPDSMPGLRGKQADAADLAKDHLAHLFTAF